MKYLKFNTPLQLFDSGYFLKNIIGIIVPIYTHNHFRFEINLYKSLDSYINGEDQIYLENQLPTVPIVTDNAKRTYRKEMR